MSLTNFLGYLSSPSGRAKSPPGQLSAFMLTNGSSRLIMVLDVGAAPLHVGFSYTHLRCWSKQCTHHKAKSLTIARLFFVTGCFAGYALG